MKKNIIGISFSLFILLGISATALAAPNCVPPCPAGQECVDSFGGDTTTITGQAVNPGEAPAGGTCVSKESNSETIPGDYPEKATIDAVQQRINSFPSDMEKDININYFVGRALRIFLGIIGTVALLVFIYSGIMWMTAGGDGKKVKDAQHGMVWAALGLFAIFVSYTAVSYMIKAFTF